jgi:hypothetical protein
VENGVLTEVPILGLAPIGTPPSFSYTLAILGQDRVYVRFSEPVRVFGGGVPFSATTWTYSGAAAVTSVQPIGGSGDYAAEAFIVLSAPIADADLFPARQTLTVTSILEDSDGNPLTGSATRDVTDIGLGIVQPVWAQTTFSPAAQRTLRDFDGTGDLVKEGSIVLSATILAPTQAAATANLIYDIDVPESLKTDGFWMPAPAVSGLVPAANTGARPPLAANLPIVGAVRDYTIPDTDPEYSGGDRLEFLIEVNGLLCARTSDPNDPRTVAPWAVALRDVAAQRGGVTIMNNVINPDRGERTELRYELDRSGMVTIQVFTLAGSIVEILQRGTQSAGTHSVLWDGTNRGGRSVARGVYFIKIVAPGISETRKVLVVR